MSTTYVDIEDPKTHLTTPQVEDRPNARSSQELLKFAGWKLQSVNWVYEKITGENLVESLLKPLLGDFDKIDQNAVAWENVAKALDAVRHNLNQGLKELDPHWEGQAAQRFERHISATWTVAIEVDSQLAWALSKKFEAVAQICRVSISVALYILNKIISDLIYLALKGSRIGGAIQQILEIIDLVDQVRKIILYLKQVIEGVKAMVEGIVAMGTALMKLKDVRSINDAADVLDGYQEGRRKYQDGQQATGSGAKGAARAVIKIGWGVAKKRMKNRGDNGENNGNSNNSGGGHNRNNNGTGSGGDSTGSAADGADGGVG